MLKRYSPSARILADYIEYDPEAQEALTDSLSGPYLDLEQIKPQIFLLAVITGKLHIDKKIEDYSQINGNMPQKKEELKSYIGETLSDTPKAMERDMVIKLENYAESVSEALSQFYVSYHREAKPKLDAADKEVADINFQATKMKI